MLHFLSKKDRVFLLQRKRKVGPCLHMYFRRDDSRRAAVEIYRRNLILVEGIAP